MDDENEQEVAITFCFKADLSATETLALEQKAYGNEAMNLSNVLGGIHYFDTEGSWSKMTR
jgi:hypothetical protein